MNGRQPARSLASVISLTAEPAPAAAPLPITSEDGRPAPMSVSIYVTLADRRRLNQLHLDTGLSVQRLVREGINIMLEKRGLPPLELATANTKSGMRR